MKTDRAFAGDLVASALRAGADEAEVFFSRSASLLAEVRGGQLDAAKSVRGTGYGVRVIKQGRLGFSCASDPGEGARVVEQAVQSADFTEYDSWLRLPADHGSAPTLALFDPAVASVSEAEAIDRALEVERAALGFDQRVKRVRKAVASFGSGMTLIVNSHGLSVEYEETACSTHVMSLAEDGGDSQAGWDFESGRYLADIDFAAVGRRSAGRSVRLLGARRLDSKRQAPVVLENSVAAEFLGILGGMLSGEAVLKGRSPLAGRIGARIASGKIRVVDDGTRERIAGAQPVDDEGVAVTRHPLVAEGILQGYMHNTYTAARSGTVSTGNAVRGGYSSVPSVGPIVLMLEAEGEAVEAGRLLADLGRGLHVVEVMGLHTVNRITGEFSVGVSGLWIERGRVVYPIREAVLSGTVMQLFEHVEAIGDDLKFGGGVGAPSVLCGDMDISA